MVKKLSPIKAIFLKIAYYFAILFKILEKSIFELWNISKRHSHFLIGTVIGTVCLGIISNQAVQPLFTPRISELMVSPLYIGNYDEKEYGLVSKLSYSIDLPLFPECPILGDNSTYLKLPGNRYRNKIYLLTGFMENNPYVYFPDEKEFGNRKSYKELKGKIPIEVTTNAWDVKSLNVDLYISEEVDLKTENGGYSTPYWWSDVTTAPIMDFNVQSHSYLLAYLHPVWTTGNYDWLIVNIIRNKGDLEIRGFKKEVPSGTVKICERDIEIVPASIDDIDYISIDLKPHEERRVIYVGTLTAGNSPHKRVPIYNMTRFECIEISKIMNDELAN